MQKKEIEKLLNIKIEKELWNEAVDYLRKNIKIKHNHVFNDDSDGKYNYLTGVILEPQLEMKKRYHPTLVWKEKFTKFKEFKYDILSCRCTCSSDVNEKKLCVHLLLILIETDLTDEEEKDKKLPEKELTNEKDFKEILSEEKVFEEVSLKFKAEPVFVEEKNIFTFKLSKFCISNSKGIKGDIFLLDKILNSKGIMDYEIELFQKKVKFDELSIQFLELLNGIMKWEEFYIDKRKDEIIIPEIVLDKAVKFIKRLGDNYSSKIPYPMECYIEKRYSSYLIYFNNNYKIDIIGLRYLVVREKPFGNQIAIYDVDVHTAEKIKYFLEFATNEIPLKLSSRTVPLGKVLDELGKICEISLENKIRDKVISPRQTTVQLVLDEVEDGGVVITPLFFYDGKMEEEYVGYTILKDLNTEKNFLSNIEELLTVYGFEKRKNKFYLPNNSDLVYKFMSKYIDYVKMNYEVIKSSMLENKQYRNVIPIINISVDGTKVLIEFYIDGLSREEIYKVLKSAAAKNKYYTAGKGGLFYLNTPEMNEFQEFLIGIDASEKEMREGKLFRNTAFLPFIRNALKSVYVKRKNENINKEQVPKRPKIGPNFKIMRMYQRKGATSLIQLKIGKMSGILADESGLGKRIQMIACIHTCMNSKPSLIITPSYMVRYWELEFKKYIPGFKVRVISGSFEQRIRLLERLRLDEVLVTSYENLITDSLKYEHMYFDNIIYDDPFVVENKTDFLEKSRRLKCETSFCIISGFLWENLVEIYYIFKLIKPEYFGSIENFQEKYINLTKEEGKKRASLFLSMVKPYLIYRTREKVIEELPEVTVKNLILDMDESERYRKLYMEYLNRVNNLLLGTNKYVSQKKVIGLITRISQICSHPKILNETFYMETEKIRALSGVLKESSRERKKIVIVSQYAEMIKIFKEKFDLFYIAEYLTPDINNKKREEIIKEFNKKESRMIVFAGNLSLEELKQLDFDTIVYYDPPWKELLGDKLEYNSSKKIIEINLIIKGTVEEKVFNMKGLKKNSVIMQLFGLENIENKLLTGFEMIELLQL